jgi:glycosyltransferase involved in cell wall biosynthesis
MKASEKIEVSVVIPVTRRYDEVAGLLREYKSGLEKTGRRFEFVYVLDTGLPEVRDSLEKLKAEGEPLKVIVLAKWFGEGTAMAAGFANSTGDVILTLPAFRQVQPDEVGRILDNLSDDIDMVVAQRYPRLDPTFNRIASKVFHALLRTTLDFPFGDLGCGVRAFKRKILDDLHIYGDLEVFLPLLAHQQGFKVVECRTAQARDDAFRRIYSPKIYVQRLLDILTFIFLVRFTKKPLRFFGLVGASIFAVGGVATLWLVLERLFFGVGLADRPALFLASLMIVLGIQMLAVGLIGELIIFTHAKDIKEYDISEIIE